MTTKSTVRDLLNQFGVPDTIPGHGLGDQWMAGEGTRNSVVSPVDGQVIAELEFVSTAQLEQSVSQAANAFQSWRSVPAPLRGQVVREIGERLRQHKEALARLVTIECGKIFQEGLGEVQEMIDICDFAVGLSRQLYGLNIASERAQHRLAEQWHPLGPVGVISAFNRVICTCRPGRCCS